MNGSSNYKCEKGRHQEVYQSKVRQNQQLLMKERYLQVRQTQKMGKGMFAKGFIPTGTIILIVKEDSFITYDRMLEHTIFHKLNHETSDKMAQFAYFLAYHQNILTCMDCNLEEWSIKRYIQSLPKNYNNLICWENQELEALNNPLLIDKIKKRKIELKKYFQQINQVMLKEDMKPQEQIQRIQPLQTMRGSRRQSRHRVLIDKLNDDCLESLKKITVKQMSKFVAAIESRNVHYQNGNDHESKVGALIPFLQMINHSKQPNCTVQSTFQMYKIRAAQDIQKDGQIFVDYGHSNNEDFLEYYGIVQQTVSTQKQQLALAYNSITQKGKCAIKKYKKYPLSQQN